MLRHISVSLHPGFVQSLNRIPFSPVVPHSFACGSDEKMVLQSQINTLQGQLERTESRLQSLSQTSDNALLREREAEDKLDAALSLHARQLGQRQSREAELERTIADLGAALAASQRKERSIKDNSERFSPEETGPNTRERIRVPEEELENEKALHDTEKQRVRRYIYCMVLSSLDCFTPSVRMKARFSSLPVVSSPPLSCPVLFCFSPICFTTTQAQLMQRELRDISKERAEEASAMRAKQLQFDRQVATMSLTISKLQSNRREMNRGVSLDEDGMPGTNDNIGGSNRDTAINKQLSEKLLIQQEKLDRSTSEISALRSRLKVAVDRMEKAEEALASSDGYDVESGMGQNDRYETRLRNRNGKRRGGNEIRSIRSAVLLTESGENAVKIGKAIDAVDRFSVDTGECFQGFASFLSAICFIDRISIAAW